MTTNIRLKQINTRIDQMKNLAEFSRAYNGHLDVQPIPRDFNPKFCRWFDAELSGAKVGHLRSILWGNGADYEASQNLNLWVAADIFVTPQYRRQGAQRAMIGGLMHMGLCDMIHIDGNLEKLVPYFKSLGFHHAFQAAWGWFLITRKAAKSIRSCPELSELLVFDCI